MSFFQSKLINLNGNVTGVLPPSNGGAGPVTKTLFVDGGRTDSYTATGAINLPFKTIGAAISQIITNADNASSGYCVYVYEGNYNEALSFNSALLYNIAFQAVAYNQGQIASVSFGLGSGTAITSTSNNTNLGSLSFSGFTINGDIILTGDINGTNFGSIAIVFVGCNIQKYTAGVLLTNINNVFFYFSSFNPTSSGPLTFHNIAFALMEDGDGIKTGITLNLQDNPAGNVPAQYGGNYFLVERSTLSPIINVDAGSELDTVGAYMGGGTCTMNGIWHSYGTIIACAVVLNNGSSFRNRGSSYSSTFTANAGSTVTNQGHYLYTPTTSANWNSVPTVVDGGLDTLATSGVVKSQTQNLVLSSPNGSSGVPSFRALVSGDLPAGTGTVTSVAVSGGTTGLTTSGGPITTNGTITLAGTLAVANGGTGVTASTGTVAVVLSTSPTLVTPTIGVATATSINKMAITAPGTSSTLAVADGKTFTANNSLTLAGTDSTTMTFPATSSTVMTLASTDTKTGGITMSGSFITASSSTSGVAVEVARASPTSSDTQNIYSGSYTPTLTANTGTTSFTAYTTYWFRVGKVVTVSGRVDQLNTSTGTAIFVMSLPITPSAFGLADAGGNGTNVVDSKSWSISTNNTSTDVVFVNHDLTIANSAINFIFSYRIS